MVYLLIQLQSIVWPGSSSHRAPKTPKILAAWE